MGPAGGNSDSEDGDGSVRGWACVDSCRKAPWIAATVHVVGNGEHDRYGRCGGDSIRASRCERRDSGDARTRDRRHCHSRSALVARLVAGMVASAGRLRRTRQIADHLGGGTGREGHHDQCACDPKHIDAAMWGNSDAMSVRRKSRRRRALCLVHPQGGSLVRGISPRRCELFHSRSRASRIGAALLPESASHDNISDGPRVAVLATEGAMNRRRELSTARRARSLPWLVLCGALAIVLWFVWRDHDDHIRRLVPYALLAACPVMHLLMHRRYGGHGQH